MTELTRVVCIIVDELQVTLYKPDGSTIIVQQGDPRTKHLVAKVYPAVETYGFCDLTNEDLDIYNHYAEVEEKTNGFVKFFRVAKRKVKEIFEKFSEPVAPRKAGQLPKFDPITLAPVPETRLDGRTEEEREQQAPPTKSAAAVAEIMANAVPSSSPDFHKQKTALGEETTLVAVTPNGHILPDAEKLDVQVRAVQAGAGNAIGLENFLTRISNVKRAHSAQDLLKFIEKGELPLADDGSVLVYKRLKRTNEKGVFVDCHSGNVKQRVGSLVFMSEHLVDPNRSNECSNGLHVARRDYLRSFSGDVCVLAKLAPEDVIAVPHGDARKLRSRAYHIIAELTQEDHDNVVNNRPLKDTRLLGNAVAGNHIAVIETVEITGHKGAGLNIVKVSEGESPAYKEDLHATSLDEVVVPDEKEPTSVDAKDLANKIADKVEAKKAEPKLSSAVVPNSSKRPVDVMVEAFTDAANHVERLKAAETLLKYKKDSKRSWTSLGVPIGVWEKAVQVSQDADKAIPAPAPPLMEVVTGKKVPAVKKAAPVLNPLATAVLGAAKPSTVKKAAPKGKVKKAEKPVTPKPVSPQAKPMAKGSIGLLPNGSPRARIANLLAKPPTQAIADEILSIKKQAKKSWLVLGVTDEQLKVVMEFASK